MIKKYCINLHKSLFTKQKANFVFNGVTSNLRNNNCGVPHGNVFANLLCSSYINYITYGTKQLLYTMFVGDTSTYYANDDLNNLNDTENYELTSLNL